MISNSWPKSKTHEFTIGGRTAPSLTFPFPTGPVWVRWFCCCISLANGHPVEMWHKLLKEQCLWSTSITMETHFLKHQHITPCLSSLDSTERQVSFSTTTKRGGGGGGGDFALLVLLIVEVWQIYGIIKNKKGPPPKKEDKKGVGDGVGFQT